MRDAALIAKAGTYLARATRLHCPVCGRTPIFPRVRTIRRVVDWFMPLDGCPRCGYAFEREPGYFLMAVWALNSGLASALGVATYFALDGSVQPGWETALGAAFAVTVLANVLLARHVKAYYIAFDHLVDPHERGGGDDRGNQRLDPPHRPWDPGGSVDPRQPCETPAPVR